jgi:hypothetical protein
VNVSSSRRPGKYVGVVVELALLVGRVLDNDDDDKEGVIVMAKPLSSYARFLRNSMVRPR